MQRPLSPTAAFLKGQPMRASEAPFLFTLSIDMHRARAWCMMHVVAVGSSRIFSPSLPSDLSPSKGHQMPFLFLLSLSLSLPICVCGCLTSDNSITLFILARLAEATGRPLAWRREMAKQGRSVPHADKGQKRLRTADGWEFTWAREERRAGGRSEVALASIARSLAPRSGGV